MIFSNIIGDYFRWHYGRAFSELFHLWLNFLWFVIHFFSIKELSRSLFAPWRRMTEEKKRDISFENIAAYIIVNLLSRVVGFIMRSSVLIVGLISLSITIVIGSIIFLLWIFLPAITVAAFVSGISLLASNLFV
jgi:hypothetical protein